MRTRRLLSALVLASLAVSGSVSAKELSKADVAALEAGTKAFVKAVMAKDWKGLAALYTEDAVLMPPNKPVVKGRAAIEAFFMEFPPVTDFTCEHMAVEGSGGVVSVAGKWAMKMQMGEEWIPDSGHFLDTRERQENGTWLIALDMFNSEMPMHGSHE